MEGGPRGVEGDLLGGDRRVDAGVVGERAGAAGLERERRDGAKTSGLGEVSK